MARILSRGKDNVGRAETVVHITMSLIRWACAYPRQQKVRILGNDEIAALQRECLQLRRMITSEKKDIPPLSEDELSRAVDSLQGRNSPGLDEIPAEIHKSFIGNEKCSDYCQ